MDERALTFARELERRDDALAEAIDRVERLLASVEALGDRAAELTAALARAPAREETAAAASGRAREGLATAGEEAERARGERLEAEAASSGARLSAARRHEEQLLDGLRRAEARLVRADAEVETARGDREAAQAELSQLGERGRELAARVAAVPRVSREGATGPAPGLDGLLRWSSHARAALWVVRSGLQNERDRVVREANELAASVLHERHATTGVAAVRERLEREG